MLSEAGLVYRTITGPSVNPLAALLAAEGLAEDKDQMPLDLGIKTELPDKKIR